jgi:hypothetical protein
MNFLSRPVRAACLLLALGCAVVAAARRQTSPLAELQHQFRNPPDDARIMMRWWWFGPTVTKAGLERDLRQMKAGGIGGVEIQPVYPVVLDDASKGGKTLPYLSAEFLDALKFAGDKARELGLRVDLTLGSGWPYGGPSVPINEAASRLRVERVKTAGQRAPIPPIAEGEKLLAAFAGRREIADLKDGYATLPVELTGPPGPTEVSFFIASRTGQQVKRAAVGSEGFVLDHYDRAAVEHYLKNTGDRLMQAFGARPPYAVFCDSLEVFGSDWTGDFLEEFQRRRGYDLRPLLPALTGDIGADTAAIRHDWGQTLTEIFTDRFLIPMRDWSRRYNTKFRIQGYGIPPMTLSGNALADLPEGEGSQWKVVRAARWASSASHLFGKPVTSSETWTWLHSPSFRATPLDVKAEADLHFLQGINQLIGHGWPYTPGAGDGVEYPGWRFYAAGVFNEKNPWWIVMPDLTRYLQRVSFMLRQGQPANDVALYLPNHDAWAGYTSGQVHALIEVLRDRVGPDVMPAILESGFNLDFFDDDALKSAGRVENGALALGANRYKAVVLPGVERIPLETLQKLEQFAAAGGTVIATRRVPNVAPGLKAGEDEKKRIRAIAAKLFEDPMAKGHFVRDERSGLGEKLGFLLQPDVVLKPAAPDVGFIHRHTETAEIYFVANTSNTKQAVQATFRVSGMSAEAWDPLTGQIAPVEPMAQSAQSVTLQLRLEPYASQLLVFSRQPASAPAAEAASTRLLDLGRDWTVTFGERGAPVKMDTPRSWTADEATRNYSGTATYERSFGVPETVLQTYQHILLDFGAGQAVPPEARRNGMRAWLDAPIRDAALIYVNDIRAGSLWCPPYQLPIKNYLKPGENKLRITIANTAINHLAGRRQPDYKLLHLRYGERFQPQDMENLQPLPSGLLGGVQLIAR